jgi:hypothetical protein
MTFSPGDQIISVEHRQPSVFIVTDHGNVWRVWLGADGIPLIERRIEREEPGAWESEL